MASWNHSSAEGSQEHDIFLRVSVFPSFHTWDSGRELFLTSDLKSGAEPLKGQLCLYLAAKSRHITAKSTPVGSNLSSNVYQILKDLGKLLSVLFGFCSLSLGWMWQHLLHSTAMRIMKNSTCAGLGTVFGVQ